ncbi:hypothetical protein JNW90_21030 [Micromonospora sp. STR1s_5]|nr:hypothetical protein [Micromonospora sp. STR1s_5]
MLDPLGHISVLEILRARLRQEVTSGSLKDAEAVDALAALEGRYQYAVLGSLFDHLLAHSGPSDTEVAVLQAAAPLYMKVRAFIEDFRAVRQRFERLAQQPQVPAALVDYNAARAELAELAERYEALLPALQAYAWRLQPFQHLVQHPIANDAPIEAWPWRDVYLSRRTGALAATLLEKARLGGTPEALAFGLGVLAGHVGNYVGSPYLTHGVSGPRRSHPYRDRLAAYAVGAWTRGAPPAMALGFGPLRAVPVFGPPTAPSLPQWLLDLINESLTETYAGLSTPPPDINSAYGQLVTHWRLLNSFKALPPPEPIDSEVDVQIVNTLAPADWQWPDEPTNPRDGPEPEGGGGNIFDPGRNTPPWFLPAHENAEDVIKEVCLDLLLLPVFLVRVGAWLYYELDSDDPPPGTTLGTARGRLETPVSQNDLDAAVAGKGLLIAVQTLSQMDLCLQQVAEGCLRVMKLGGLLYPESEELPDLEFRQFLVLPGIESPVQFVWPARPPDDPANYLRPPDPSVENPDEPASEFAQGEKPIAFLVPGAGGGASAAAEGFEMFVQELLGRPESVLRNTNHNLDADRGVGAECWTPADGTSIGDDPVSPKVLGYGNL